jgi:hypothetical protein
MYIFADGERVVSISARSAAGAVPVKKTLNAMDAQTKAAGNRDRAGGA